MARRDATSAPIPATRTATAPTAPHVAEVPVEAMVCGRVLEGVDVPEPPGAGEDGAGTAGVDGVEADGAGAGAEGCGVTGVEGPGAGAEGSGVVGWPIEGFGTSATVHLVSSARYSSAVM